MPWRRVAPALVVPALLLGLNLVVFLADVLAEELEWGWFVGGPVAGVLAFVNGAAIIVLLAAVSAIARAARLTTSRHYSPFAACVRTYRVAVGSALLTGAAISGTLLAMSEFELGTTTTWALPRGLGWAVLWILAALALMVRVPAAAMPAAQLPRLAGRAVTLDPESRLGCLVESVVGCAGATRPRHVVFGFDPGIASFEGGVELREQRLEGATLYLSLPMLRVLGRGELAGLIALALADEPLRRAGWPAFLAAARNDSERLLSVRPSNRAIQAILGVVFLPLEMWAEQWEGIELRVLRYAAQRGAVVAGRETISAALARRFLYPGAIGPFLAGLRREVREASPSRAPVNVVERLSQHWSSLPAAPHFASLFESLDALGREQPLLATLIAGLGVEPPSVIERLRRTPSDPAIDLVEDAASMELALSRETIDALMPGWPARGQVRGQDGDSGTNTQADKASAWKQAAGATHGIERPLFAEMPAPRRSVEGSVIRIAAALFLAWGAWATVEPAVERLFPEVGATKVGPKVFPFTVHLGRNSIAFTNPSGAPWSCNAEVGFPHVNGSFVATFPLAPRQTRELPYTGFTSTRPDVRATNSGVRRAARGKGSLECAEPSGVLHSSGW
jgi:hypothetical protein